MSVRVLLCVSLLTAACEGAPAGTDIESAAPAPAGPGDRTAVSQAGVINPRLLRRFKPLVSDATPAVTDSPALVDLGKRLWFETKLSKSGTKSCDSCHELRRYGVDGLPVSPGHDGSLGRRNTPTVYNAANHFAFFWDGRARTLEEQAVGPIVNPIEMGMTEQAAVAALSAEPGYAEAFAAAFPGEAKPITMVNIARALAAFERKLVTQSRWDAYLAGDESALTRAELEGLRVFLNVGCVSCHTGPQVGASMFRVVGEVVPWPNQKDEGRFEVTNNELDRMVFKVPTLKNITETAPYFHDGSAATLKEAVTMMGKHQLGIDLAADEVNAIIAFFGAMKGELPLALIEPPNALGAGRAGVTP